MAKKGDGVSVTMYDSIASTEAAANNGENSKDDGEPKSEETKLLTDKASKPPKDFKSNRYAANKTAGQAATNLALVTSNASQLKKILVEGPTAPFYIFFVITLITSILLQVGLGFMLLWVGSRENKLGNKASRGTKKTDKINNTTLFVVFAISILNVVMNAFAIH